MFEKYSEDALRCLFYAREAVSEHGGGMIEPEHIVLGVLLGAPSAIPRFATPDDFADSLRTRLLVDQVRAEEKLSPGVEIPFAETAVNVLKRAAREADDFRSAHIEPEHLLLGVLVNASGVAADALHDAGVKTDAIGSSCRHPRAVTQQRSDLSPFART